MTARTPHALAGQTLRLRPDIAEIGGKEYHVEDWWINVAGLSWMWADGNPAAMKYAIRAGMSGLPTDDEVLYGKVGGLGHLVHVSEIAEGGTR